MNLPILYEDNDVVAVLKPAGVMTHPDGRSTEETASDWFAETYPESASVGETQLLQDGSVLLRPGVVHRLDRETSGVLVFAKTPAAHEFLKNAFQERTAKKTYIAFVYGVPKEKKGTIEFSIGRSRKDFRLRSAQPKAKGALREALTRYEVIASDEEGKHALLYAYPETGRTHQIRVHLKAIHHPVVADALYAPGRPTDLGFSRLGLHAYRLDLPLPSGGRKLLEAPLPSDLAEALPRFPNAPSIASA
jgi:23S rRNA pseudouridine1911/1915/1917 synthase